MKREAKVLRVDALKMLAGHWYSSAFITPVYSVISIAVSLSFSLFVSEGLENIIHILLLPMYYSFIIIFLQLIRNPKKEAEIAELFDGFKDILWTLLLIVPGIIKSYSYALVPYILKDEPE